MQPDHDQTDRVAQSALLQANLGWFLADKPAAPADAMLRIQAICVALPDAYVVAITVLVTHPTVPKEILAAALKRFRKDFDCHSNADVVSMLIAAWNGGKSGFDSVQRTRATAPKRVASVPWVKE